MTTRILIVDDSSAMRSFIRAALEESDDVEIQEAENGFAALKVLPRGNFQLVLVDLNMPDINGLELISFMRKSQKYKETPLLIVSTESSYQIRERGMALGADAYLVKPFTIEELKTAVATIRTK